MAVTTPRPTAIEKKKKIITIQHSCDDPKAEMPPTVHQGTQVDDCHEHSAVFVSVPGGSCITRYLW